MVGMAGEQPGAGEKLGRNVVALTGVSLLTDVASEMSYPLLPMFLTVVLGASATALGTIEGLAESLASLCKLLSGRWSDRAARRKPLVVAGYSLASAAKPLVGLAVSPAQVLAVRLIDRAGKGLRQPPRDALITDSVSPSIRGRAFGFHRAGDNLGAVLGPLVAFALLRYAPGIGLRQVFLLAAVPAALSVALLILGVREPRRVRAAGAPTGPLPAPLPAAVTAGGPDGAAPGGLGRRFWWFLAVVVLFTLGNSSDAFLLLRATRLGVGAALVPVLWALLNLVKAFSNVPGGALSDRFGRRPLLVVGWTLYAAVYFAFGAAHSAWQVWALFAVYGLYFGATEGVQSALVADFAPPARRGTAFGLYNLALGLGALPASLLFGLLADRAGAPVAFTFGGTMALLAALAICFVAPSRGRITGA
jgi:MFS family permease